MKPKHDNAALIDLFREVTESLIALFELYEADDELTEATAETLGRIFDARVKPPAGSGKTLCRPLYTLLCDIRQAASEAV